MMLLSPWFWLAIVVWSASLTTGGLVAGHRWAEKTYAAERAKEQLENERRTQRMLEANLIILPEYIEGETKIKKVFVDRVIEKVVPHEVIVKSDSDCGALPVWFVELWNSANQARLPDAAKGSDGGATDVVLSDASTQHDAEAKIAAGNELQLHLLKEWIRKQFEAVNGEKAPY